MVQKQKSRDRNKTDGLRGSLSDEPSERITGDSTASKLYQAVMSEGNATDGAISGVVTSIFGLVAAGILPFTILPMLVGFSLGGLALSRVVENDIYSVMGGTAVSAFLTFLLFVNIPILGLGLISTAIFTVLATGGTVATYEYAKD